MTEENQKWQFVFEAIGTHWVIDINNPFLELTKEELEKKILDRIEQFDQNYSRFRKDSLVTKMANSAGTYTLPEDAKILLDTYQKLYDATKGAVTPLIGQTMEQAGYDSEYSLVSKTVTSPPKWEEALTYEFPSLTIKNPAILDFGAAGKGYLVDIISEFLSSQGIKSFCVDAGGDIYHHGDNLLSVGLENPNDPSQAIGVAKIQNQSICASAGNRRKWEGFHHIINPHTKTSPEDIIATWVVSPTAILADGLATCLFFMSGPELKSQFNFEYLILYKDYSIEKSDQFPAELFYK